MADPETVPEINSAATDAETPAPVKKPRKPRAPKVSVEPTDSAPEKPKATRTRKPRVAPVAAPEDGIDWPFGSSEAEDKENPAIVVAPSITPAEPVVPAPAQSLPEEPAKPVETAKPVTAPTKPAPTRDEAPKVEEEPKVDHNAHDDETDDNGGALTLDSLFGQQKDDPEAEAKLAEEEAAADLAEEVYSQASDKVLYATNGVVVAPGYWQAWAGKRGRINVFAWLGVIFAFVLFPLGLLFSGLGYINAKAVADDKLSRRVAAVGLGLSVFVTFLVVIPLVFKILFGILSLLWAPLNLF
jgi:hypothetical protein